MIVSCEACQSRYKLDDAKVGAKGAKITCPKCKHVFVVRPAEVAEDATMAFPKPTPAPKPAAAEIGVELGAPEPTEIRASRGDVAAQAQLLDFRKVGVVAWKVKVRIGLIYDFSDIKTLRKYISEGRVTPQDVISYDGKNWRQIGEIGDLDTFFLDTYAELEESYVPPAPPPTATPKPANEDDLAAAAAAALAAEDDDVKGPKFSDPFAKQGGPRPKGRGPARGPAGTGTSPLMGMAIAAAVVVIAAGWWFTRPAEVVTPPAPPAPAAVAAPKADVGKELRDKVKGEIDAQLKSGPAAPVTSAPDPMELTPINRGAGTPPGVPDGSVPIAPKPAPKATASTANDHLAVGDDAARSGDWSMAAQAYGKAAALDGRNAALQLKLGEALMRAGDTGGAQGPLLKAATGRQAKAWKLLGDISRAEGDAAGANGHYQKYLATNPPDAGAVKALMGGG